MIFFDIIVLVLCREDNAARERVAVRIIVGHQVEINAAQLCKIQGKTAGFAAVQAPEIAVKKTVRIKVNHKLAGFTVFSRRTERTRRLQMRAVHGNTFQMLLIKLFDLLIRTHGISPFDNEYRFRLKYRYPRAKCQCKHIPNVHA